MEKIALITDTTSDLSDETIKKFDINLLPFRIQYKDREFRDKYDISSDEVYKNFKNEIPKSSMPSLQDMEDVFNKLEAEGYTHSIVITLSSGLSGIYNAVKMTSANHTNIKTFVFDSRSISYGEGYIVEKCGEMIRDGKSFDEITAAIPKIRKKIKLFFVVGTLEYLIKGGRIGRVSGKIGEMLNIKPIITVDDEGVYTTFAKVRGRKQSLNKIVEVGEEYLKVRKHRIYIMSGDAEEESQSIVEKLKELPNVIDIEYKGNISPVAGVHSGPGLVGVVFIEE